MAVIEWPAIPPYCSPIEHLRYNSGCHLSQGPKQQNLYQLESGASISSMWHGQETDFFDSYNRSVLLENQAFKRLKGNGGEDRGYNTERYLFYQGIVKGVLFLGIFRVFVLLFDTVHVFRWVEWRWLWFMSIMIRQPLNWAYLQMIFRILECLPEYMLWIRSALHYRNSFEVFNDFTYPR